MRPKSSGYAVGLQHEGVVLFKTHLKSLILKEFERFQGFSNHLTARRGEHRPGTPSDYHNPLGRTIGKSDAFHALTDFEDVFGRAEIKDQDLVLPLVYAFLEEAFEHGVLTWVQFAKEHAVLDVVTSVSQGLETRPGGCRRRCRT